MIAHEWIWQRRGGDPADAGSSEMVRYCKKCGVEDNCEDDLPPCEAGAVIEFYKQFIAPSDPVFDIGANIGERTEIFAQIGKRVIAVDPISECFVALIRRAETANITALNFACGAAVGSAKIFTSDADPLHQLASMSRAWVDEVRKSARFGMQDRWDEAVRVSVTTLDVLIKTFGKPAFIKIDVEGYELEVLKGLSQPVRALSFEFTPECIDAARDCVAYCIFLGMTEFSLSLMETFELTDWMSGWQIIDELYKHRFSTVTYGDVYARMPK